MIYLHKEENKYGLPKFHPNYIEKLSGIIKKGKAVCQEKCKSCGDSTTFTLLHNEPVTRILRHWISQRKALFKKAPLSV